MRYGWESSHLSAGSGVAHDEDGRWDEGDLWRRGVNDREPARHSETPVAVVSELDHVASVETAKTPVRRPGRQLAEQPCRSDVAGSDYPLDPVAAQQIGVQTP